MEQLRLLLAIVAALLAAVFFGVWWVRGRQRSTKGSSATLVYALLLLCSSGLLLLRAQQHAAEVPRERAARIEPAPRTPSSETPVAAQTNRSDSSHSCSVNEKAPSSPGQSSAEPNHVSPYIEQAGSSNVVSAKAKPRVPYIGPPLLELPKRKRDKLREPADVVEAAVLDAFEVIDLFFDKFGSPATSSSGVSDHPTGQIEFLPGTAVLSGRSLNYFRAFAPELSKLYKEGRIEIRAQSDDTGSSPAQRYLLTQSRAETVRDALIAGGIPFREG
ncbi:MAG: hypothetical protein IPG71_11845 [bacterium]|nr:hypothetical protein [bacterium]